MQVNRVSTKLRLCFKYSIVWLGALFVAVLLIAQIWRSGWCNDESAHIPAGLYHLETGRMDAYRVNPPLPRMLAAIPLLIDHPRTNWFSTPNPRSRNEYMFAHEWVVENLEDIPRQLRLARLMMIAFFVLGAWTINRWASDLYGRKAGWLALAMWSLSPDVITYSAAVSPDLPAAATGLFACYWYWKWLYAGKNEIPWEVCIGVALATLSKFSWLFLFLLLPCITLLRGLTRHTETNEGGVAASSTVIARWQFTWPRVAKLAIALTCTVMLMNLVYGFEGTGQRLGDFEFLSQSLGGEREPRLITGNRFRGTAVGALPMPVPKEMLQGIDYLKWEFERGMPCYLAGEWKFRGWWYFYLVAMAVKFPIGYIVLIAIGSSSMVAAFLRRQSIPGEWIIPLVAIIFIALVSSQTGFTHHLRYVLPSFGFLYILAARSMFVLPRMLATITLVVCLTGTVVYHVTHLGQSHAHFNWLAGGPEHGWRYLSLSNVDWGQSTFRMATWARSHPQIRPLTVVFVSELGRPSNLVADLDVDTRIRWQDGAEGERSTTPTAGWYLLSSEQLTHKQNMYFRTAKPESWPFADAALFYVSPDSSLP